MAPKQEQQALSADRVDRGLEWLKQQLPSLNAECANRREVEAAVSALSQPAHPAELMVRVLALLNPYFEKDTPQAVREAELDDWAEAIGGYPMWAVQNACRWWKSGDNADRRKRPLEGDIAARCRKEMDAVNAAKLALSAKPTTGAAQTPREALTDDQRADRKRRVAELQGRLSAKMEATP
jgi:hypothetical protein